MVTRWFATISVAFVLHCCVALGQDQNVAPPGFKALFNGKDLSGWHGLGHFDPRQLAAMSEEERNQKRAADLEDLGKHWRVEQGESLIKLAQFTGHFSLE